MCYGDEMPRWKMHKGECAEWWMRGRVRGMCRGADVCWRNLQEWRGIVWEV